VTPFRVTPGWSPTLWMLALTCAALVACGNPETTASLAAQANYPPITSGQASATAGPQPAADAQQLFTSAVDVADFSAAALGSPTTADLSVPLKVDGGRVLGIESGTLLSAALRTLGVKPVVEPYDQPIQTNGSAVELEACSEHPGDRWVISSAGLTLVFEGPSASTARLSVWRYTGGPAVGFTALVAPHGVVVGGTREDLLSAFEQADALGDTIDVGAPVNLRFGLEGDVIAWFGNAACGGS
jgi:hypothetical protein